MTQRMKRTRPRTGDEGQTGLGEENGLLGKHEWNKGEKKGKYQRHSPCCTRGGGKAARNLDRKKTSKRKGRGGWPEEVSTAEKKLDGWVDRPEGGSVPKIRGGTQRSGAEFAGKILGEIKAERERTGFGTEEKTLAS